MFSILVGVNSFIHQQTPSSLLPHNHRQLARRYLQQPKQKHGAGAVVDLWAHMKSLTLETVTQASFSLPLGLMDEAAAADRWV